MGLETLGKIYNKYDVSIPFEEINRLFDLSLFHKDFFLMITAFSKRLAPPTATDMQTICLYVYG